MRPTIDQYMIEIAKVVATRSTCSRRAVGAVITDHSNHILSTGFNGVPTGVTHCTDVPCKGVDYPSGQGLDYCKAQHAEVNAFAHCREPYSAFALYVTVSPCMSCMKLIAATNIRRIICIDIYNSASIDYFVETGGAIIQLK